MNRYPVAKPPRWWSPKPSVLWMNLYTPMRILRQKREERIRKVSVRGLEHVRRAIRRRRGVLITPNHPGHADGYLLWEALCRLRRRCYVMMTWQCFDMVSRLEQWQYRLHGCFSVDRDGNDRQAFKQSVDVLADSSNPLAIFPEGEVYHLNDRVMPFREGTAGIAQAAVKRSGRPVECFPCALRYYFVKDPTPELEEVTRRIEETIGRPSPPGTPLVDRVQRLLVAALEIKEREYLGEAGQGELPDRTAHLAEHVLAQVDAHYGVSTVGRELPERVKRLRQLTVDRRLELGPGHDELAAIDRDVEDLFFCMQLFSYPADYLLERPTIERVAETIDKLEEDVLGLETARTRRATRHATITFGEPIVIHEPGDRHTTHELTDALQARVQALLDAATPPKAVTRSKAIRPPKYRQRSRAKQAR